MPRKLTEAECPTCSQTTTHKVGGKNLPGRPAVEVGGPVRQTSRGTEYTFNCPQHGDFKVMLKPS